MKLISSYQYIEKKSKFNATYYEIENDLEVKEILEQVKKNNKDARHICYAYICNGNARFSDDNEPKGTAGKPIYQVLDRNHINKGLVIVVRYFGGTKLGASHLLRAYVKAASEVIKKKEGN